KFWKPFVKLVEKTEKNVSREQVAMAREIGKDPVSGKPMSVRMGQYGPFVQIGTKDDEEKPRFAGLRPGQKMDTITLEQALELFKLPRALGETPEGEKIVSNVGRFGPYLKYGDKYVSLKEDDPYTVELPRALEVIRLKKEADANRIIAAFPEAGVQVLNGRFGPYVTDGKKNAKIPKDREPKTLTLEECRALIEAAPVRFGRFGRGKQKDKPVAKASDAPAKAKSKAKSKSAAAKPAASAEAAAGSAAENPRKSRSRKPPDPQTTRVVRKKSARAAASRKKRA